MDVTCVALLYSEPLNMRLIAVTSILVTISIVVKMHVATQECCNNLKFYISDFGHCCTCAFPKTTKNIVLPDLVNNFSNQCRSQNIDSNQ